MSRLTLRDILVVSAERYGDLPYIRYRQRDQWEEITYSELYDRLSRVSELLYGLGIRPGDRVAILLENEPHWPEVYFGIVAMGATAVPIDSKLTSRDIGHVIRDSRARVVVIRPECRGVIEELHEGGADLTDVVVLGSGPLQEQEVPPGLQVHRYDVAIHTAATGTVLDTTFPRPDDVASIIYTSGTTGRAKGVMLTHRNFAGQVYALARRVQIFPEDSVMVVLPLHHAFSFTANMLMTMGTGASMSFARSVRTLSEDMREARPTILLGVPLLLEKIQGRIEDKIGRRWGSSLMYRIGMRRLILRKVHDGLGGRLRILISGGAPADPACLKWFAALGVDVLEGYGLTETAPALCINPPGAVKYGTVGPPAHGVQVRIAHPNAEGVGEIQAKGPNIFRGYFANDEATAEAFEDGWFCTGDLGHQDSDGYLTICGRIKNMVVNREGKNIYPEEVELCIAENPYISEVLVLGFQTDDEKGERVGCIVVPDNETLDAFLTKQPQSYTDEQVIDFITDQVKRSVAALAAYKRPRRIVVRFEELEKTSTMKVKRYLYAM